MSNTIWFCLAVYGIGTVISFFVVFIIKGIYMAMSLAKNKSDEQD